MKKLTFALFVALGASLFVSCGPKVDTPENLGKSLLEAMISQDQQAYADLFITQEEMNALFEEAGKIQMDEAMKSRFEQYKKGMQDRFNQQTIQASFDEANEDAKKASLNWENVEFVSAESGDGSNEFNINLIGGMVQFKPEKSTESNSNFYLRFYAVQIGDEWKIIRMSGLKIKKDKK